MLKWKYFEVRTLLSFCFSSFFLETNFIFKVMRQKAFSSKNIIFIYIFPHKLRVNDKGGRQIRRESTSAHSHIHLEMDYNNIRSDKIHNTHSTLYRQGCWSCWAINIYESMFIKATLLCYKAMAKTDQKNFN